MNMFLLFVGGAFQSSGQSGIKFKFDEAPGRDEGIYALIQMSTMTAFFFTQLQEEGGGNHVIRNSIYV